MTEDPPEVVRRLIVAFNAFDLNAVLAVCAPDVVVEENPAFPDASTYRGHDGVRQMLARWAESFVNRHTDVHDLTVQADRVALLGSTRVSAGSPAPRSRCRPSGRCTSYATGGSSPPSSG